MGLTKSRKSSIDRQMSLLNKINTQEELNQLFTIAKNKDLNAYRTLMNKPNLSDVSTKAQIRLVNQIESNLEASKINTSEIKYISKKHKIDLIQNDKDENIVKFFVKQKKIKSKKKKIKKKMHISIYDLLIKVLPYSNPVKCSTFFSGIYVQQDINEKPNFARFLNYLSQIEKLIILFESDCMTLNCFSDLLQTYRISIQYQYSISGKTQKAWLSSKSLKKDYLYLDLLPKLIKLINIEQHAKFDNPYDFTSEKIDSIEFDAYLINLISIKVDCYLKSSAIASIQNIENENKRE